MCHPYSLFPGEREGAKQERRGMAWRRGVGGAGNNGDVFARDFQGRALRGPTRRAARLKARARHRDPRR